MVADQQLGMKELPMEQIESLQSLEEIGARAKALSQEDPTATTITRMGWTDSLRIKFHSLWLHQTDLWEQVRRFGSWLEFEAAPIAVDRNESEILLEMAAEGAVRSLRIGTRPHDQELGEYARLWGFLWSLGIRAVHLDARLERNQIEDVVHDRRKRRIRQRRKGVSSGQGIRPAQGIHEPRAGRHRAGENRPRDVSAHPRHDAFQDQIQWAAGFMPAEEVGGDYFDVAELDDTRVAILFGDVSGHGMAAAFVTAIMKTTFRAWLDAEDTLEGLARQMHVNLLRLVPIGSFAAVFIAIYDRSTRRLHYTNCGHQPEPWHIPGRPDHAIHSLNDARNLIMGVEERADFHVSSVTLEPGDMVLFVSDGIVENPNVVELSRRLMGESQKSTLLFMLRLALPYGARQQYDEMEATLVQALIAGRSWAL